MPAIQVQAENKVMEVIRAMGLAWPPAVMVCARRRPWHKQGDGTVVVHPGITIYPLRKSYAAGTNEREDVGYGVGIAIIAPTDHSTADMRDRVPTTTEAIRRKLVEDRLTLALVPGAIYNQTKVRDLDVNIPNDADKYEVSGLEVRCWVREPRT